MEEEKVVKRQPTMNEIFADIRARYQVCKSVAEHYEYTEVKLNDGMKPSEVMDEWAKQVNKTNLYRQKEKDLEFTLVWLQDVKSNLSNVPSSKSMAQQVDILMENTRTLLKVYITIGQMQSAILKYYERGGATF